MKKYLIIIGGATASGKTALAIRLAQYFATEILSADSRQFYREMTIGTAKPTQDELSVVKHHFINNISIHDVYSVGEYEREALKVLSDLFEKKDVAIMVGGTGLYIRAICEGLDEFPEVPLSIKEKLEHLYQTQGIKPLQEMLKQSDYEYYQEADIQNPMRLIRALSVCEASGNPFSSYRKGKKSERDFLPIYICLDVPREVLYDRINKRVDAMIEAGLVDETRTLYPFRDLTALQTVGYTELFDYFDDKMTLHEAIDKIKQHTRNYAKRQTTWFRKDVHWQRFAPNALDEIVTFIQTEMTVASKSSF